MGVLVCEEKEEEGEKAEEYADTRDHYTLTTSPQAHQTKCLFQTLEYVAVPHLSERTTKSKVCMIKLLSP